jgi:hypothetical protein
LLVLVAAMIPSPASSSQTGGRTPATRRTATRTSSTTASFARSPPRRSGENGARTRRRSRSPGRSRPGRTRQRDTSSGRTTACSPPPGASVTSADYKAARVELQQLLNSGRRLKDARLRAGADAAAAQRARWREFGGDGRPSALSEQNLPEQFEELRARLDEVERVSAQSSLGELPLEELQTRLGELVRDRSTLQKLPELHRLEQALCALPLVPMLDELKTQALAEERAAAELRSVWLLSILDSLAFTDLTIATFDRERHEATVNKYRTGDKQHIESTPKRKCARRFPLLATRAAFPTIKRRDLTRHVHELRFFSRRVSGVSAPPRGSRPTPRDHLF